MIKIALVIGLAFVIQFVLSSFQMKNFNNEFVRLRRKGKVAIGRKSGGFHAGAIVMFRIDEKGIIQESRKIEGTTFLARVKDFPGFEGRYVGDLSVNDVEKSHKNLRKAVEDAALTYKKYMAGEEIAQPPSREVTMNILVKLASGFMNLFTLGGEQFVSWVTGIIPTVLMLLLLMNAIIALAGDESVNKLARVCTKNPILRYLVLPFVSAFMLGNPMALSMGKFMPEFYKPAYYASATYHCHTNNGIFPHINASELFVWLGIANGISTLKLDTTPLAVRYLLVGLVANFISGWVTEFTTRYVEKQQGVKLSRTLKISEN